MSDLLLNIKTTSLSGTTFLHSQMKIFFHGLQLLKIKIAYWVNKELKMQILYESNKKHTKKELTTSHHHKSGSDNKM